LDELVKPLRDLQRARAKIEQRVREYVGQLQAVEEHLNPLRCQARNGRLRTATDEPLPYPAEHDFAMALEELSVAQTRMARIVGRLRELGIPVDPAILEGSLTPKAAVRDVL
jgi:hypothetical protein